MQVYLIFALLFSLLVSVFAIQNTEVVVIKFLTFHFSVSLVLVILGSAVVGALVLYFFGLFKQLGFWWKTHQLGKEKEELDKQVKELQKKLAALETEKTTVNNDTAADKDTANDITKQTNETDT